MAQLHSKAGGIHHGCAYFWYALLFPGVPSRQSGGAMTLPRPNDQIHDPQVRKGYPGPPCRYGHKVSSHRGVTIDVMTNHRAELLDVAQEEAQKGQDGREWSRNQTPPGR